MAYNIKLFVHGVPNGQDIWGNPGADAKYIEAFYGRKSNVASQMILEVMQFGGETNAYYTYFYYNDKIQDKQNRLGGYFALTLRINYYYADVQNIYNLLQAAFNKYIIGSVLDYTAGGGCRFLVSQLNQANENFMALEKELEHYLMQFSSNKDFVALGGFKSNGQNDCGTINLLEAAPNVVLSHVKSTGKISVSALHPTSKEQQIINKMNSEVQAANTNAQQQIAAARQKAQQDIQTAQRDKEQGIQAVKNEYKDADKTISQLRAQIDKANKNNAQLTSKINDLNSKLQDAQGYKTKYDESQKKLAKLEELVQKIKNNLSGLSGISELLGISSVGGNAYGDRHGEDRKPEEHSNGFESFIKKIHPFMDFFVMLILICIIGVTLPKSCESKDTKLAGWLPFGGDKEEVVDQKEHEQETSTPGDSEDSEDEEIFDSIGGPAGVIQETLESLRTKYPNAKIDVSNINQANGVFMRVSSGANYTLSIKGVTEDLHGEWVYDPRDFYIQDDNIIPRHAGRCSIVYKVNGIEFLDRTITVKQ